MRETGGYTIGEELGRGALGRVVVVQGPGGERLAGKILHRSHQADERARARFAGEAEIAAGLVHDNVARVHGLVEIAGDSVLLMELVEGPSLAAIIARSAPVDEPRLVALGTQLADGLEAAHHAGLIHRDLKPENILVATTVDGVEIPKIVDFGLARATSFAGVDSDAFAVVGTADYMAPESLDPLAVDARSDLYSLGCILFEMATGAPPFGGATAFAVLEAHCRQPIDRETIDALLSPALAELVVSLLAKSPADRPQSAAQVRAALGQSQSSQTALAVLGATSMSTSGRCAECGAPSIPEVPVCFGCGRAQMRLESGHHTVFVTGPGATTHKLDTKLRQALVDWLTANPRLGLAPAKLEKKVPRLPFVLATGVSEASGRALAGSLESLGFEVEVIKGGRFSLPSIRKKGMSLGGRMALIGGSVLAYGFHNIIGPALIPALGVIGLGALGGGFVAAVSPAARRENETETRFPETLARPLSRVTDVVPALAHRRHRDSLRGVVQRVLAVRETAGEQATAELDASLGELVDLAVLAGSRIDSIDTVLEASDLRNSTPEQRRAMLERDALAARLLEITAFLDSMRVRFVALAASGQSDASLDDLRAHIEALEEIEAL